MPNPKKPATKSHEFYSLHPWRFSPNKHGCEILAYVEVSGKWETIMDVRPTSGADAEALAAYVTAVVNQHHNEHGLLHDAMKALELCLEEGMTYSSEQEADHVIARIKSITG